MSLTALQKSPVYIIIFFTRPLVNHPVGRLKYGFSLDWTSLLVERVSGMPLDEDRRQISLVLLVFNNRLLFYDYHGTR